MGTKHKQTSVYPGPWARRLMGKTAHPTQQFNLAIECWALKLGAATTVNERHFDRREWEVLSEMLMHRVFRPNDGNPAEVLASGLLTDHAMLNFALSEKEIENLANKLRSLDFDRAWALIWACDWAKANLADIEPGDHWWTLEYRREHS